MNPSLFASLEIKEGDVFVTCPPKSGTHWSMQMVYQLLSGGDTSYSDIYDVVPWVEWVDYPGQSDDERCAKFEKFESLSGHRVFKSHMPLAPGPLPINDKAKYVVMIRNPFDAYSSMVPFIASHRDEFFDAWGLGKDGANLKAVLGDFSNIVHLPEGFGHLFPFLQTAWVAKSHPNVHIMHYTDAKADLAGTMEKLAAFLEVDLPKVQFAKCVEHCTYSWMKKHEEKFAQGNGKDLPHSLGFLCKETRTRTPPLLPSALLRKGAVGEGKTVLSDEHRETIVSNMAKIVTDEAWFKWCFEGSS